LEKAAQKLLFVWACGGESARAETGDEKQAKARQTAARAAPYMENPQAYPDFCGFFFIKTIWRAVTSREEEAVF
jgi:hypothetical protein